MNFEWNEDQVALAGILSRYVADRYDAPGRKARLSRPEGYDITAYEELADLGLIALRVDEAHGGIGGSLCDFAAAMQALGPGLIVDPWLPALLSTQMIARLGSDEQKQRWIPPLAAGRARLSVALSGRWSDDPARTTVRASAGADGPVLDGTGALALGDGGDGHLIVARADDAAAGHGIGLFLLAPDASGLAARPIRLADGSGAQEINLKASPATQIGEAHLARAAIEEALAEACVALSAEAIAIMDAMMTATVEHLQTRRQFGARLGSFQAIQHRMADCVAKIEVARGLTMKAAIAGDDAELPRAERLTAAFGAKALVSQVTRRVGEEGVQFHGAIGITEELWVGRAFKRLILISALLGDERTQSIRLANLREGSV